MRKDYISATEPADHETEFVEKYWTAAWEREGGPQGRADRIPRKEEYRAMAPYIAGLQKGARLLDGGCGLGDWTLCFERQGFSVAGLDLSRQTVAQLKARFERAINPHPRVWGLRPAHDPIAEGGLEYVRIVGER